MKPSINRSVHYVARGSGDGKFPMTCRAATITEVGENRVGLCVINPMGFFFYSLADDGVRQDEHDKAGGTWHWPEQVE